MGSSAAFLRRWGGISRYANSEYALCFPAQLNRTMSTATSSDAASPPSSAPCLMLPPTLDGRGNIAHTFHCLARKEYLIKKNKIGGGVRLAADIADVKFAGSSHGWLALSDWSNHDRLFLSNPITDRHVRLPSPPRTLFGGAADRVILTSPISVSGEEEEATALMIFDSAGRGRLAFCRPSQTEWTRMGELDDVYENILYSTTHKRLFCVSRRNYTRNLTLECWNVGVPNPPALDWVIDGDPKLKFEHSSFPEMSEFKSKCFQMSYLVCAEHSGELFLVVRHVNRRMGPYGSFSVAEKVKDEDDDKDVPHYANYYEDVYEHEDEDEDENGEIVGYPYKTVDFDVYKIDTETGAVKHVKRSLQGLAMFVGINHPFAIPGVAGVKPNSIYFTDENRFVEATRLEEATKCNYGGHDNGIFDYRNKEFSAICDYYPVENHKIKKILPLPMWFTPSTL